MDVNAGWAGPVLKCGCVGRMTPIKWSWAGASLRRVRPLGLLMANKAGLSQG